MVHQYERKIEHFYKNEKGIWLTGKVVKTGELAPLSIPLNLPLLQIYHAFPF